MLTVALAVPAAADPARLAEADRGRLERGELVLTRASRPDYPWPELTVYGRAAAPPEEVMAVYADFASHATYLPGLVQSRVVGRPGPGTVDVAYEYEVVGPNERYTLRMTVRRDGAAWETAWELVEARYARRLSGGVRVTPHERGALVAYTSRVDPGPLGAALGSPDTVARDLVESVRALVARVERMRAERPEAVVALVRSLSALAAAGGAGSPR